MGGAVRQFGFRRLAADERCGKRREGRGRLDPVTALSGEPEESIDLAVETRHRRPVRRESAQTRPAALDTGDRYGDGLLVAIEPFGKDHVIDKGIMRLNRRFVARRDEKPSAIRLHVPGFIDIIDQRPASCVMVFRSGQHGDGPAHRREAKRMSAEKPAVMSAQAPDALTTVLARNVRSARLDLPFTGDSLGACDFGFCVNVERRAPVAFRSQP